MRLRVPAALASIAFVVGACASGPDFDREAAVQRAMSGGAGLERPVAECYVDRVVDDLGSEVLEELEEEALPNEGLDAAKVAIRVDCIGVTEVGRPGVGVGTPGGGAAEGAGGDGASGAGGGAGRPDPAAAVGPWTFGADEALDALWGSCERGSGGACDRLFDDAPIGSDYEVFGATCGSRGAEPVCAEVYPD